MGQRRMDDQKDKRFRDATDRPRVKPGTETDGRPTGGQPADETPPPYQTYGAGGLDFSDRGAATADEASTGGEIGTEIGGERSTGGMPKGMAVGTDLGRDDARGPA